MKNFILIYKSKDIKESSYVIFSQHDNEKDANAKHERVSNHPKHTDKMFKVVSKATFAQLQKVYNRKGEER